ncbi:MAG TPA: hypothetical protein VHW24_07835, partial [Bryobacteraceae bacterium]|nr:hypothetical protein [Bryobacteraceae bacterium]
MAADANTITAAAAILREFRSLFREEASPLGSATSECWSGGQCDGAAEDLVTPTGCRTDDCCRAYS